MSDAKASEHRRFDVRRLRLTSGYWFLASPYSKYKDGTWRAAVLASKAMGALIRKEVNAFSPIAHSMSISMYGAIDEKNHAVWMGLEKPLLEAAHGLVVLMLDGWEVSEGVVEEIKVCTIAGKPIIHLDPADLE